MVRLTRPVKPLTSPLLKPLKHRHSNCDNCGLPSHGPAHQLPVVGGSGPWLYSASHGASLSSSSSPLCSSSKTWRSFSSKTRVVRANVGVPLMEPGLAATVEDNDAFTGVTSANDTSSRGPRGKSSLHGLLTGLE